MIQNNQNDPWGDQIGIIPPPNQQGGGGSTASPTTTSTIDPSGLQPTLPPTQSGGGHISTADPGPQPPTQGVQGGAEMSDGFPVGGQQQSFDWLSQLWEMVNNQPQFQPIQASMDPMTAGALGSSQQAINMMMRDLPGYAPVDPSMSTDLGRLNAMYDQRVIDQLNRDPLSYAQVPAEMSHGLQNLDNRMVDFAGGLLDEPTRYDTQLFQGLHEAGLGRLDQAQSRDRLNLLRDANQRLGPRSGQLTNEYIDLAAEYDRNRHEMLLALEREAALTQMQDRLGALSGAQGVSTDVFGREAALRDEARTERGFERETDVLNEQILQQAMDRMERLGATRFEQEAVLRGEARTEREFQFQRDLAEAGLYERAASAAQGLAATSFGIESGIRSENRQDRDALQDHYQQGLSNMFGFGQMDFNLGQQAWQNEYDRWQAEHGQEMDWWDRILRGAEGGFWGDGGEAGAPGTGGQEDPYNLGTNPTQQQMTQAFDQGWRPEGWEFWGEGERWDYMRQLWYNMPDGANEARRRRHLTLM